MRKLKDELTKRDSKKIDKKSKFRKGRLNPKDKKPPKYRYTYINEEE